MCLVKKIKIVLDDDNSSSNQISITFDSLNKIQIYMSGKYKKELFELHKSQDEIDYGEGWISVTRRRHEKSN